MEESLVSVVILTWERKVDVVMAVQSVYDQDYQNIEIIVVDNGSTDGTSEILLKSFPKIKLIVLDHNTGSAAGRNPGIRIAKGKYIFLLDSDASLRHDTLTNIVYKFQTSQSVGAITCKFINMNTRELDPTTWIFTEKDKAFQDEEFQSFSLCEGGAALRREVLDRVGLFWELLFFGREGEDLGLRVLDAGYQILYYPKAVVYHRASLQKRVAGGKQEYYNLRNCLFIYFVRYPWWMLLLITPLKIGTSLVRCIKNGYIPDMLQALLHVVRKLPVLCRERHTIRNATACRYLKLQREHGPLAWKLKSWLKNKI